MRTSWSRDEISHLLTLSGNLAGLSITGVTIFYKVGTSPTETIVDDILAITALLFLLCCYISFFYTSLKPKWFDNKINLDS